MEIQIIEKRQEETEYGTITKVLTKSKDFVRFDEWLFSGLCTAYRMLKMLSNNLLEVTDYHHCHDDEEPYEEAKEAYVETDAGRVITKINSFRDFDDVYQMLYECIVKQNGWGKTVKC